MSSSANSPVNERERHVAMLQAALPYVSPENRRAMEIVLRANSLASLINRTPNEEDYSLSAAEYSGENENNKPPGHGDMEAMLLHIREYCTPKEADIVQVILNFIHADKLFKNYRKFADSHPDAFPSGELSPNNNQTPMNVLFQLINGLGALSGNMADAGNQNNYMMEFLKSQLSPEQKNTFEQLQNIMYNN